MNGVTAHGRDLLDMIDFRPLLENHNHDTLENLKGTMYDLYSWCPVVSGDQLYEYLKSRYPQWMLKFSIQEKTNAYQETYNEYTILYNKNSMKVHARKALKKLVNNLLDLIDDEEIGKLVSEFTETIN